MRKKQRMAVKAASRAARNLVTKDVLPPITPLKRADGGGKIADGGELRLLPSYPGNKDGGSAAMIAPPVSPISVRGGSETIPLTLYDYASSDISGHSNSHSAGGTAKPRLDKAAKKEKGPRWGPAPRPRSEDMDLEREYELATSSAIMPSNLVSAGASGGSMANLVASDSVMYLLDSVNSTGTSDMATVQSAAESTSAANLNEGATGAAVLSRQAPHRGSTDALSTAREKSISLGSSLQRRAILRLLAQDGPNVQDFHATMV